MLNDKNIDLMPSPQELTETIFKIISYRSFNFLSIQASLKGKLFCIE